ncbi:zyxin-like, partial [Carcharodon carcharias]|uniref:zyxin-like n=1 Tax=Carcharodon carcharias TaxID=13397 RepID=UPI001B7E675E
MLNEMQNNDPYKSRLKPSGQAVNGRSETSAQQEPVAPQPCLTGPRMAGDSPAGVGPKPAGVRPTAPRASARPEQSWPGPEARPGGEAKAPSAAQKPSGNRGVVAKEGPGGRKQPEREASSKPSQSSGEPLPLSYKDVEDLEKLATQFMQEMDKEPKTSVRPTEICARCRKDLSRSEAAVRAMGSLFHVDCFLCEKCHQTLQGQQFYEVNGDPLCESCHN